MGKDIANILIKCDTMVYNISNNRDMYPIFEFYAPVNPDKYPKLKIRYQ